MDALANHFEILPLNEKERLILAVLYERGPIAVSRLAAIAKIERTLTYKIMKELVRKNYAHAIKMDKGLVYKAQDIETIIFEQERGVEQLRDAEKYIEEKRNARPEATDLMVFEGDEGIRKSLYYGMENATNEEMLGIYGGTFEQEFIPVLNERHLFNRAHNIRSKVIFPQKSVAVEDFLIRAKQNEYATECRIAPAHSRLVQQGLIHTSLEVFQNNLKIYSFSEKRAIVITDSQAVDMQRLVFTMLWESSKKVS